MRSEQEMYDLILDFARNDERIRAVVLNGSRANSNAPRDKYQDFDIVYIVREFEAFRSDDSWINYFGKRLILQMPEAMRYPGGEGHFNWMMLLKDGNRIDLTLIPIEKLFLLGNDSLSVVLLDKDGILPHFPPANEYDYIIKHPSELFYLSCCNNFWWCLQNVAKGLARDELPYVMQMYNTIVLSELHNMIEWYIGAKNGFSVSAGKMGKYFKRYLPEELYKMYYCVYPSITPDEIWNAVFTACDLFHKLALAVADHCGFSYNQADENGIREYMQKVRDDTY